MRLKQETKPKNGLVKKSVEALALGADELDGEIESLLALSDTTSNTNGESRRSSTQGWQRLLPVIGLTVLVACVVFKEYIFEKELSPDMANNNKTDHTNNIIINHTTTTISSQEPAVAKESAAPIPIQLPITAPPTTVAPVAPPKTPAPSTAAPISTTSFFLLDNLSGLKEKKQNNLKFFLVAPPETTSQLVADPTRAANYYKNALNEESAEIWLHRSFARMTAFQANTPHDADVILVAGYLHLKNVNGKNADKDALEQIYEKHLIPDDDNSANSTQKASRMNKPHLLLFPTWNPGVAKNIGIPNIVNRLKKGGLQNLWSVGFERNPGWQGVLVKKILPIPYVVHPHDPLQELLEKAEHAKVSNSVFYAGDSRKHAEEWGGCSRTNQILPLQSAAKAQNLTNIDVRLVGRGNRLSQEEYNHRMLVSEYCLILCGDTPTSRSLTSSMVAGCIPIQVGNRLQGKCDPPCRAGWGWSVSGADNPHLPYTDVIPWDSFPEIGEQELIDRGPAVLEESVFQVFQQDRKNKIHSIMQETLSGWIYGWGDPVTSTEFGDAVEYIWNSFGAAIEKAQSGR